MKKLFKASVWATLTVVLALSALTWLFWGERTAWPTFPAPTAEATQTAPLAPQVVVQVERDYGWRTGDRIPVTIYVKQQPGTIVDTESLAIEGDFEILRQPDAIVSRDYKDGTRLYKIVLDVQSMNVQKSWTLNANMSYQVVATSEFNSINLPGLKLYTSYTYDGARKELQEGEQAFVYGLEALIVGGILAGGLLALLFSISQYRKALAEAKMKGKPQPRPAPLTPLLRVNHNFKIVWRRIKEGDTSVENYKELERNIRWLYHIESRTIKQIEIELEMTRNPFKQEVMVILTECDKVLYQNMYLNDAEHEAIFEAFQRIFTGQPLPPPPPPPIVINWVPALPPDAEASADATVAATDGDGTTGDTTAVASEVEDAAPALSPEATASGVGQGDGPAAQNDSTAGDSQSKQ